MNGELSFFELGVGDVNRARDFYGSLFGWRFVDQGEGASIETPNIPEGYTVPMPAPAPICSSGSRISMPRWRGFASSAAR
jgi:uncharacterized protein